MSESYGIKISREGLNVKNPSLVLHGHEPGSPTYTYPIGSRSVYSMNSTNFFLKSYISGSTTATVPANSIGFGYKTTTISHDLGYKPICNAWWSLDNATWFPMFDRSPSYASTSNKYAQVYPSSTNLSFSTGILANSAAYTVYWRYVIYVDAL